MDENNNIKTVWFVFFGFAGQGKPSLKSVQVRVETSPRFGGNDRTDYRVAVETEDYEVGEYLDESILSETRAGAIEIALKGCREQLNRCMSALSTQTKNIDLIKKLAQEEA